MLRKALTRDWRDASTLMLVAKTAPASSPCTCGHDLSAHSFYTIFPDQRTKIYNKVDAKSAILNSDNLRPDSMDFKTLMLTRSSKSKFMPNALVFPGGVVDEADCSLEWFRVLDQCMGSFRNHPPSSKIPLERRPPIFSMPMFTHEEDAHFRAIATDYALRICALRETFEEIGILLVTDGDRSNHKLSPEELSTWRQLVRKNPENFRRMCEEIKMAPNIWSLYEWSNWLTPVKLNVQRPLDRDTKPTRRRFDTMFYVAMIDEVPPPTAYSEDEAEIVKGQWLDPIEALDQHYSGTGWMAPPQIYEQSRLLRLSHFEAAQKFSALREEFSLSRWLPVPLHASDGVLSVLPGDSLYPADPAFDFNHDEPPAFQGTIDMLREKTEFHNRFEIRGPTDVSLICNIEQTNNHIMPLSVCQSPS